MDEVDVGIKAVKGGNRNNHQDGDTTLSDWHKIPPAHGASQKQEHNGKTYSWCGTCQHSNLTHTTDKHQIDVGRNRNTKDNQSKSQESHWSQGGSGTSSVTFGASV